MVKISGYFVLGGKCVSDIKSSDTTKTRRTILHFFVKKFHGIFNCNADVIGLTPRTLDELITMKNEGQI